jgi:hypothetical protein
MCQIRTTSAKTRPARANADAIWTHCEMSRSERRSRRSATTPMSENSMIGVAPKGVEAEEQRRTRQREDQPALGDRLHPGPNAGGKGAEPEHPEIAVGEGGGDTPEDAGRGGVRLGSGG